MSVSQPSPLSYVIDVPKAKGFAAKFQYDFYVSDEAVNLETGVPATVLARPADTFDTSYISQLSTRVPRFVRFDFTPVEIPQMNGNVTAQATKANRTRPTTPANYIGNNIANVLNEDYFASSGFTAVNLNDQSIDTKLFNIISGTAVVLTEDIANAKAATSHNQLALNTDKMTSPNVSFQFLSKYLAQPSENNTFFYEQNAIQVGDAAIQALKNVDIHVQVNSKFLEHIVDNAIVNPCSTFNGDYTAMKSVAKTLGHNARNRSSTSIQADDYKTQASYIDITSDKTSTSSTVSEARVVGYIIDKWQVLPDGTLASMQPIVLESPTVTSAIDVDVLYYATYVYSIRTVAEFKVPSIVNGTNELVTATLLIASHPSRQHRVTCVDNTPPKPPWDVNFRWDFAANQMVASWSVPPTPQRDAKKFQVFRRATINEPFQLVAAFDFNDAQLPATVIPTPVGGANGEAVPASLVTKSRNPIRMFRDAEFTRDSQFIYAVCTVDAHGLTSNYSEQFQVSFNRFTNALVKKRISSSGAPKPYPNLYLDTEAFVDAIVDKGHTSIKVVFNPEYLAATNGQNKDMGLMTTTKDGGHYRMLFINTDLQLEQTVDITIDDLRTFPQTSRRFQTPLKPGLSTRVSTRAHSR